MVTHLHHRHLRAHSRLLILKQFTSMLFVKEIYKKTIRNIPYLPGGLSHAEGSKAFYTCAGKAAKTHLKRKRFRLISEYV